MDKKEYIERNKILDPMDRVIKYGRADGDGYHILSAEEVLKYARNIPSANVTEEEHILKFYYVRSMDDYWIGMRVGNFYYAEYDSHSCQWIWTHSRYLPWGEHVIEPDTLWKEHTYPSKPEEIPFEEWLQGFLKKYVQAYNLKPVVIGRWIYDHWCEFKCSNCGAWSKSEPYRGRENYCYNCGADMREGK